MSKKVSIQYDYEALVLLIRKVFAEELARSDKKVASVLSMDMLRDMIESTYYDLWKAGKLRVVSDKMSAEDLLKLMNSVDKARKGQLYDAPKKKVSEGKVRVKVTKGKEDT